MKIMMGRERNLEEDFVVAAVLLAVGCCLLAVRSEQRLSWADWFSFVIAPGSRFFFSFFGTVLPRIIIYEYAKCANEYLTPMRRQWWLNGLQCSIRYRVQYSTAQTTTLYDIPTYRPTIVSCSSKLML